MRRLLTLSALAVAAASFAPAAHAAPTCTPTAIAGACVTVLECTPLCHPAPVVDPYCDVPGPVIAACVTVDAFYITVPPSS